MKQIILTAIIVMVLSIVTAGCIGVQSDAKDLSQMNVDYPIICTFNVQSDTVQLILYSDMTVVASSGEDGIKWNCTDRTSNSVTYTIVEDGGYADVVLHSSGSAKLIIFGRTFGGTWEKEG